MPNLLGIDVGTTGAVALLIDASGEVCASVTTEYGVDSPRAGWAEQEPQVWWEATCASVRGVIEQAGVEPSSIEGVGVTGQMHGLIALDDRGEPIRPCIMWNDQRAKDESAEIERRVGRDNLIRIAGKPAGANFTAPKLLWLKRHEPEAYAGVRTLLLTKDYVRYRLTGSIETDVNDASGTLLFDVGARRWSDDLASALQMDPAWLPEVHESTDVVGTITADAAGATGLVAGTPVIAGCGDQAADAIGLGVIDDGQTSVTVGTSGVILTSQDAYRPHADGALHTYAHALPGRWHTMGVTLAAGGSLRWFLDELGEDARSNAVAGGRDAYDVLLDEAATAPPGSEELIFLPYLNGERTPHLDPRARGAYVGLTQRHDRAHLIRATLEGVTFSLLDCLELARGLGASTRELRASGGGVRSRFWRQMLADVFAADIVTLNTTAGAAFGAALLAGVGSGVWADVREATTGVIRETGRTAPGPQARQYAACRDTYRALYPALATTMHRLSDLATE